MVARPDEDVFAVQVGMIETGGVQPCEFDSQVADELAPLPWIGAQVILQEQTQVHGSAHLLDQEERPTLPILTPGDPARTADSGCGQGFKHPRLALRLRRQSVAGPQVCQPVFPRHAMLALQKGTDRGCSMS
jgi:hypothetical protein